MDEAVVVVSYGGGDAPSYYLVAPEFIEPVLDPGPVEAKAEKRERAIEQIHDDVFAPEYYRHDQSRSEIIDHFKETEKPDYYIWSALSAMCANGRHDAELHYFHTMSELIEFVRQNEFDIIQEHSMVHQ